ncbi:unnamed protein product [Musa hybrid cultivar]
MAKLTAQGSLRLTLCGDRASFWCEPRDQVRCRIGGGKRPLDSPVGIHRSSSGFTSPDAGRVWAVGKKSKSFKPDEFESGEGKEVEYEEAEEENELQRDELSCFRGLVLDVSYRPINVVCWKRAICLEFMEKADVLEYYDQTVSSTQGSFYIPAVLQIPHLLQVVKRRRIKQNLSRRNIFYRDSFTCQYCSSRDNLTVDHVVPISRGGEWMWENLVPKDYDILAIPLTSAAVKMLKMRKGVEGEDESLEWLSIYVEDCLSGATSYTTPTISKPLPPTARLPQNPDPKPSCRSLAVPAKARTKRRRITPRNPSPDAFSTFHLTSSDPPLLQQTYWLAESELIVPIKEEGGKTAAAGGGRAGEEEKVVVQPRRCSHCLSQKTPQWRAGPLGPKTLCNACGVRFKSGRLLPEYRPAKSPTFVSFKHSNSHKKVMEMRMALLSSNST